MTLPSEEDVRAIYVHAKNDGDLSGLNGYYAGADFDAWLKSVKAEAWDAGHRHCFHVEDPKAEKPYNPHRRNDG